VTQIAKNYIANEWLAGESEIENLNPSDISDIVGHYAQASKSQLNDALSAARAGAGAWGSTQWSFTPR
jgi:aldehyde dehydrogenase (NAD+)